MHSICGILKWSARSATRFISWSEERLGSVIMRRVVAPVIEAITGQPTPGGPSVMMRSRAFSSASVRACCLIKLTSWSIKTLYMVAFLSQHVAWRKRNGMGNNILKWEPPKVLTKYYPGNISGIDKERCPIFVDCSHQMDMRGRLYGLSSFNTVTSELELSVGFITLCQCCQYLGLHFCCSYITLGQEEQYLEI